MKRTLILFSRLSLMLLVALMFSGCQPIMNLFKKKTEEQTSVVSTDGQKKEDAGKVLLRIDGKDVLTEGEFKEHLAQMFQMHPQLRGISPDSLPLNVKEKYFEDLIKQKIILAWAEKTDLSKDAEFIKTYKKMKKQVKEFLQLKTVEDKIFKDITVSDSDVSDYYEKNKNRFIKEQGGVDICATRFDNGVKADAFLVKAKGKNKSEFEKLGKAEGKSAFKDFGVVSEEPRGGIDLSGIPPVLKAAAFKVDKFPTTKKIEVGKDVWVMLVSSKKDNSYYDLKEIKPQLENMLKQNKFKEAFDKKIDEIKSGFKIEPNKEYFKEPAPAATEQDKKTEENVTTKEEKNKEAA